MTSTPKPRRWFQFRLRTLLVLMLLVSIGMGWFALKVQRARKQRAAVEAIERLGGAVTWSSTDVLDESRGRAWLRKLLGDDFFAFPKSVEITNDAAMEYLTELTQVSTLVLVGRQITDAGLGNLKGLTNLQGLLFIDTPQITGDGLRHLKESTQLTRLALSGPQFNDAGLEHLKGLNRLRALKLLDTQVSESGVARLKQALPNCRIFR